MGRPFYEFEPEPLLAELQRVLGELDEICRETQNLSEEVYQDFSLARMVDLIEEGLSRIGRLIGPNGSAPPLRGLGLAQINALGR